LGVSAIVPWQSDRTVSRWDGKETKGRERWQSIVDEAAKQSLRVWFPVVHDVRDSKGLAELVSELVAGGSEVLVLDPTAQTGLAQHVSQLDAKGPSVTVIVGPEGGISPAELEQLSNAGAKLAHLGTGILRTSTAGMAALALLIGQSGSWD
jgi:16S rRNA (uracil1498-N3)-methyltransferase